MEPQLNLASKLASASSLQSEPQSITVLVEDDSMIRWLWQNHFNRHNRKLLIFATPEGFIYELPHLNEVYGSNIKYYLDQDFGEDRGVGVKIAERMRESYPSAWISLVTGYRCEDFVDELKSGLLDAVCHKFPHHIFPPKQYRHDERDLLGEKAS